MTRLLSLLAALSLIAGSAQAQDQRVWRLYNGPDQVTLVYGVPDTDDVAQVLMCAPGHRIQAHFTFEHEVAVRLDGDRWLDARGRAAPWPARLSLASGAAAATLDATTMPDQMNGGSTVSATFAPGGPVMTAFARSGRLRASAYGETVTLPPAPLARVRRFLALCAR